MALTSINIWVSNKRRSIFALEKQTEVLAIEIFTYREGLTDRQRAYVNQAAAAISAATVNLNRASDLLQHVRIQPHTAT